MIHPRVCALCAVVGAFTLATISGCLSDSATSTTPSAPKVTTPITTATNETVTRTVEDGGTGPYKAILVGDSSLTTHTIFRPKDMSLFGDKKKLPLVSWGNGACNNNTNEHEKFLSEIASHGYLIIGIGPAEGGRGNNTKSKQLLDAIDWAIAQNSNQNGLYYNKIDTTKIAVAGMSCGGLQALEVSPDPRVTTTMICNSGIMGDSGGGRGAPGRGGALGPVLDDDQLFLVAAPPGGARGGAAAGGARGAAPGGGGAMSAMPNLTKEHLTKLHAPIIYILGGSSDIAYNNGMDDYKRIEKLPAFAANMDTGHGGTYGRPHGGEYAPVAIAWLDWQLKGDMQAAKMFTGNPCELSKSSLWKVEKKNIP